MQSLAAAGARQQQLLARRPGAAPAAVPSTPRLRRSPPSPFAGGCCRARARRPAATADEAQVSSKPEELDLEEEVERFMLRQAELESGGEREREGGRERGRRRRPVDRTADGPDFGGN